MKFWIHILSLEMVSNHWVLHICYKSNKMKTLNIIFKLFYIPSSDRYISITTSASKPSIDCVWSNDFRDKASSGTMDVNMKRPKTMCSQQKAVKKRPLCRHQYILTLWIWLILLAMFNLSVECMIINHEASFELWRNVFCVPPMNDQSWTNDNINYSL